MKCQTHTHVCIRPFARLRPQWRVTVRYLEQQVCGFGLVAAAARIKAPVTDHEHRRLQDVAAAPVVLETAVIKVHGEAQRLEIESHCDKKKKANREKKIRSRDTVGVVRSQSAEGADGKQGRGTRTTLPDC